ncbi:hypothetical protein C8R46DRAFT_1045777 [Mycena filopes]|nr:hypothetical protein C8R46DRAFT_1045777 [Mycena filopes]
MLRCSLLTCLLLLLHPHEQAELAHKLESVPMDGAVLAATTTHPKWESYYTTAVDAGEGDLGSSVKASEEIKQKELKLPGPPRFAALRAWEENMPQHNLDLPFPEGKTGRYVKFSNQMNLWGGIIA